MSLSRRVAYNTLVQVFSKATTVIFGLLTTILLTGYLGREGFGDYMFVITLVILFGAFADWGTMTIGVREAAKYKNEQGQILANIFLVRLALSLIAVVLMALAALILPLRSANPEFLRQAILIGSLVTFLFATKASFGIIFQTNLVMQKLALVDITTSILTYLLSLFFVMKGLSLIWLVTAVVLANITAFFLAWYLASKTVKLRFLINREFIKSFIKESIPMGLLLLVFTIDNKIDTVMLGSIKGSGPVGIYAVAYRIYDVLILGAAYLMISLLPVFSRYSDVSKWRSKLIRIYQKAFDILVIMGVGVLVGTFLLAPLMVRVITQQRFEEFIDAVFVLRILSLSLFLAYFNHLIGYTIVALGHQRFYLLIAIAALTFNVVANLLIIPLFSYFGAAWVTVFTEGLILVIAFLFISRLLNYVPSFLLFPKTVIELLRKRGKIF
jgi:O-antigen/teichoic acid export membrane protein